MELSIDARMSCVLNLGSIQRPYEFLSNLFEVLYHASAMLSKTFSSVRYKYKFASDRMTPGVDIFICSVPLACVYLYGVCQYDK